MLPPTQIIRTSRTVFGLTVAGALVIAIWSLTDAMWDETTLVDAIQTGAPAMIGVIVFAMFGAALTGLLALLCGAQLSRQYCWLLSVASGILLVPTILLSLVHTLEIWPQLAVWLATARLMTMLNLSITGACFLGGIVLAVLLTRTRLGLARRSRRAAWIGLLFGGIAVGAMHLSWLVLVRLNHASSGVFNVSVNWGAKFDWMIVGSTLFIFAALGAVFFAERYDPPRFAVLTVNARSTELE